MAKSVRPGTSPAWSVAWDAGFRLAGSVLALDAQKSRPLSFVSDAHHRTRHQRIVCTDKTLRLLRRGPAGRDALPASFGRPFQLGALTLELFPAGHVLGAAQLLAQTGAGRLVYCGGFQPHGSLTAEKFQARRCDVLLLDSPYDAAEMVFPPVAEARARIVGWATDTLAEGNVPVLLGTALGKAQELVRLLGDAGLPLRVHRSIHEGSMTYRALGVTLPPCPTLRGEPEPGQVVLYPPHLSRAPAIRALRSVRVALVSGRAVLPGEAQRVGADIAFPLSDYADRPALLAMIRETGAKQIVLSPRHGADFARALKRRGLVVTRLTSPQQLPLTGL